MNKAAIVRNAACIFIRFIIVAVRLDGSWINLDNRWLSLGPMQSLLRIVFCLRPTLSCLFATQRTTAATFRKKVIYILGSVIICDLFSCFDTAQCYDHDTAIASHWLRVWLTGMIDVTGHIPPWRAVDGPPTVQCEHISCATCLAPVSFLGRYTATAISRDIGGTLDRPCSE